MEVAMKFYCNFQKNRMLFADGNRFLMQIQCSFEVCLFLAINMNKMYNYKGDWNCTKASWTQVIR